MKLGIQCIYHEKTKEELGFKQQDSGNRTPVAKKH